MSPHPGPRSDAPHGEELVERLSDRLEPERDVAFAYLFGSAVKGGLRRASDVDVALWLTSGAGPEERLERALRLEAGLEGDLGRPVQTIVLNDAPLELRRNVLGHGVLVCCRDGEARRAFYVDTGRRYYDLAHAREIFRAYRDRRLREDRFGG